MAEGIDPDRSLRQERSFERRRACLALGVHDLTDIGVPLGTAPQHQAQQGAHERVVILTVAIQDVPTPIWGRALHGPGTLGNGFLPPDPALRLPRGDRRARRAQERVDVRRSVRDDEDQLLPLAPDPDASHKPGMALWREKLFAWMLRNAASAMEFFRLPTNRVVELGTR
jgi:KUP system potassium uptake protein